MDEKGVLQKVRDKALSALYAKTAAYHEGMASDHKKMEEAHKAHSEQHETSMGKAEDPNHAYHKASAAFHKSMATTHERANKRHAAQAEILKAQTEAADSEDPKKIAKLLGIEEVSLSTETPNKPAPTAAVPAAAATPATPAAGADAAKAASAPQDINDTLSKALDSKLTEAVSAAFERVLTSEDFNQKVDQAISSKLLEKLGSSTVPSEVKTFAVPRTENNKPSNGAAKITMPDLTGLDPEYADLVKVE